METKLKTKEIVHNFPALYKNTISDMVVLFTSKNEGTVIQAGNGNKLGDHISDWTDCDKLAWKRLNPGDSVELIQ